MGEPGDLYSGLWTSTEARTLVSASVAKMKVPARSPTSFLVFTLIVTDLSVFRAFTFSVREGRPTLGLKVQPWSSHSRTDDLAASVVPVFWTTRSTVIVQLVVVTPVFLSRSVLRVCLMFVNE